MEKIILFDGVCNLCDKSVQWVLKRDKNDVFLFAPMQGKTAEGLKIQHKLFHMQSVVLIENEKVYTESTAVLRILKHLRGVWKLLYVFILLPKPLRDSIYRFIAKRRYQWFGKKESCLVPTPQLKNRFLD